MKSLILLFILISVNVKAVAYDCSSPRPEMAGSHNMVLFGDSQDELYVYHLPLFEGAVNGEGGHVLMHVYQGIWKVSLDEETKKAYGVKFLQEKSKENPYPFFSISPRGEKFKVPEMFCKKGFQTDVLSAYGHVEGNPNFPHPEVLVDKLSSIKVKGGPVFARRFDKTGKGELTYILFGTPKQYYAAHFLTDDENSFDQIVAISISSEALKEKVKSQGSVLVSVSKNHNLVSVDTKAVKNNNKFSLPSSPLGQSVDINTQEGESEITIEGLVYFNSNRDLKIQN